MTPGFSPHVPGHTGSIHSAPDARSSFTSFAPSRSDSGWSSAHRCMSFGQVEDLSLNYHNQNQNFYHPQTVSMDYRRRASDMHPPSLQMSNNSSNTSISEAHMTPLSAQIPSPPPQHWGVPSTWSSLPNSSLVTKGPDQWYSEPTILAQVQEEDFGPHYGGEPAIVYADADSQ